MVVSLRSLLQAQVLQFSENYLALVYSPVWPCFIGIVGNETHMFLFKHKPV